MDKVLFAIQQIIQKSVDEQKLSNVWPNRDVKRVFLWDPVNIAESITPAVVVQPMSTWYNMRGSQYDEKDCMIEIRVVINAKAFFNDTGVHTDTITAVRDMVLRLEQSGEVQDTIWDSLAGLIQKNTCLKYDVDWVEYRWAVLSQVLSVEYTFNKARWYPTYEWVMKVRAKTIWNR